MFWIVWFSALHLVCFTLSAHNQEARILSSINVFDFIHPKNLGVEIYNCGEN